VRRSRVPVELEAALLLAGASERRLPTAPRTRELLARVNYDRFARDLADRRLLPLVGSRAIEAGEDLVPDSFRDAVTRSLAGARAQNLAVDWATRRASASLAAAGIPALPLKGPVLAAELHGDIGLRATSDADLLISRDQLDAAADVLVAEGYSPPRDVRRPNGLPDLHLVVVNPQLIQVELHWRIHWYESAFSADMLARARPGPEGLLLPEPDDLAASLLLFYSRDGFHGLRWAADLAAWWEQHRDTLTEAFLEGHTQRYPELRPALSAAARVADQVAGVPASEWLGGGAVGGRRVALATRLADWTEHDDRDQLLANIALVGGLLGPPSAGRAFVRRELLSYGVSPWARGAHVAKSCVRYVLALWRVRGRRRLAPVPTLD
jgi:hypothetical protein